MKDILNTLLRTSVSFFVLLVLMRLLGKKQLGQMTFFTYIAGIVMGNIAGDIVVNNDNKLAGDIAGLAAWAFLTFLIEYISLKSSTARVFLDGEPTIIIKKGQLVESALASQRLNIDDLTMLLRNKDVFSIKDVDYALLEPNGQLSVLKKPEQETVIKKDMGIPPENRLYLPAEIIVDGRVVEKNLKELGLNIGWLENELCKAGINSVKEVLFAELQSDGSLYISKKQADN